MTHNDFTDQLQALQEIADKQHAEQKAQDKAAKEQSRQEQIEAGACTIVPFPRRATKEPFRSDLTVEQNSLFVSNRYKKKHFVREWKLDNGSEDTLRRVAIGKNNEKDEPRGVLKQAHQDVFYRLLQLWGELTVLSQ